MKGRIIALVLTVVLCLSFCGCDAIDKMRETTFSWGNEQKTILISRSGVEYKRLPNKNFVVLDYDVRESGYIANEELPLLLVPDEDSEYVYTSADGNYVSFYTNGDTLPHYDRGREYVVFCRSDRFEETDSFLEKKEGSVYGYWYYDYEPKQGMVEKFREFSTYEVNIAKLVLDLGNNYEKIPRDEHVYDEKVNIHRYNKERDLYVHSYDIVRIGDKPYIALPRSSYVWLYSVPDKYVDTFKTILKEKFDF